MQTSSRARCTTWLLALMSALGGVACSGPRDATPLPEPPALDPGRIRVPDRVATLLPALPVSGSKGAAPANAVVRVTNLDSQAAPVATTADSEGAFTLMVPGVPGNELRFQAVRDGERSAPIDFVFGAGMPPVLTPSPRHACVALAPGFELSFAGPAARTLTLLNSCPEALGVSNPRQRLGLTVFALTTPLPLQVAAASDGSLSVQSTATAGEEPEDTLFVDLTTTGGVLRYPVTLFAP